MVSSDLYSAVASNSNSTKRAISFQHSDFAHCSLMNSAFSAFLTCKVFDVSPIYASGKFDAFIASAPVPSRESSAKNSNQKRSSFLESRAFRSRGGVEKSARRPGEFLRIFASDRIVKSARPSSACRDSPMCRRPDIVFHSAVYETAEFLVRLTEVEVEVS